jgi:hypothetical protein
MNRALLQNALLGTEKMPFRGQDLPADLRQWLEQQPDLSDEQRLLSAAAWARAYRVAGAPAEAMALPMAEPSPTELRPTCKPQAVGLWLKIRELDSPNPHLESLWLGRCAAAGQVLAPELLTSVLAFGATRKQATLWQQIAAVAGERGRWLARQHAAWSPVLPPDAARTWAEGKLAERAEVLRLVRHTDADLARRWLTEAWPTEGAAERTRLLGTWADTLTEADVPLLEHWQQELAVGASNNAAVRDLKQLIVKMLLRFSSSRMYQTWRSELHPFFQTKKRHTPTSGPTASDQFLRAEVLTRQFGVPEVSAKLPTEQHAAWWLVRLAALAPPALWADLLDASPADAWTWWEAQVPSLTEQDVLLDHLLQASVWHADVVWVLFFLKKKIQPSQVASLLGVLSVAERERFLLKNPLMVDALPPTATAWHFDWSLAWSREVLRMLYQSWAGYYFHKVQQIMPLDVFFHPDIRPYDVPGLSDPPDQRNRWLDMIAPELEKTMAVKRQLLAGGGGPTL